MSETEVIKMGDVDWTPVRYNSLEENDLFWLQTTLNDFNSPMRKIDESTAFHLRDQKKVEIKTGQMVYLKD
tara:strand:- start:421 stop:633 length:213 start_codon:yes stop_codon:yes gene_type:complete